MQSTHTPAIPAASTPSVANLFQPESTATPVITRRNDSPHILDDLEIDENGLIVLEFEITPDEPAQNAREDDDLLDFDLELSPDEPVQKIEEDDDLLDFDFELSPDEPAQNAREDDDLLDFDFDLSPDHPDDDPTGANLSASNETGRAE